jgi:hypothetical protein
MSKNSNKQRVETLMVWISWISKQKGYPKAKVKVRTED